METTGTGFTALFAKPAAILFVLVAGILLAFGVCYSIQIVPLVLGLACFILLVALSRLRTANLVFAFIVADHLCQFFKRAIFLLGPQPIFVYWGFQLLPTLILFLAVASSLYSLRKTAFPLSSKLLMGFIAIGLAQTFLNPHSTDLLNRFAGCNLSSIPLFAAFVGMTLPPSEWRRAAKLFLVLITISALYGLYQFVHGPTAIDRAWALQTGNYSIEASKVFAFITGTGGEFRSYSYYSDPSSWGYFMVLGALFTVAIRKRSSLPPMWLKFVFVFTLIGIVVAQTRTIWVALFGALLVHRVLRSRSLRHPIIMITGILVAYGLVLSVGHYALVHWTSRLTHNSLMNRYTDVGTISARVSAAELFVNALPRHIIQGDGYGTAGEALETINESKEQQSEYYSHNAIVGLLLSHGLFGLLLFGAFLYRWLWECIRTVNYSDPIEARSQLWIIAACVGILFTGALSGQLFLNSSYFMMFLGFGMGETIRLRQRSQAERSQLARDLRVMNAMSLVAREARV